MSLVVNAAYIEAVTAGRPFCRVEDRLRFLPLESGLPPKYGVLAGVGKLLTPALQGVPINHPELGMCLVEN